MNMALKRERERDGLYASVPLERPSEQIRLLDLEPGAQDDPIAVSMSVYSLVDPPRYRAVSYTWGDLAAKNTLYINGLASDVQKNAYDALWQARGFGVRRLWIDSICINQGNSEEKSTQVSMMYQIFGTASEVLACAGIEEISDILGELTRFREVGQVVWNRLEPNEQTVDFAAKLWAAGFEELRNRRYFNRLWVVQEIHAARSVQVIIGTKMIHWPLLCYIERLYYYSMRAARCGGHSYLLELAVAVGSAAVDHDDATFFHCTSWLKKLSCTDPRDYIYATLDLMAWSRYGLQRLKPDYTKSTLELAQDLIGLLPDPLDSREISRVIEVLHIQLTACRQAHIVQVTRRLREFGRDVYRVQLDNTGKLVSEARSQPAIALYMMPLETDTSVSEDPMTRLSGKEDSWGDTESAETRDIVQDGETVELRDPSGLILGYAMGRVADANIATLYRLGCSMNVGVLLGEYRNDGFEVVGHFIRNPELTTESFAGCTGRAPLECPCSERSSTLRPRFTLEMDITAEEIVNLYAEDPGTMSPKEILALGVPKIGSVVRDVDENKFFTHLLEHHFDSEGYPSRHQPIPPEDSEKYLEYLLEQGSDGTCTTSELSWSHSEDWELGSSSSSPSR